MNANCNIYASKARPSVVKFVGMCGGNPFKYGASIEKAFERYSLEMSGYKRLTTFANDFALAELFGDDSVRKTYAEASKAYKDNYKFLTELEMVLNWLCWFWDANKEPELSRLYAGLFYECRDKFYDRFRNDAEAVEYHFNCTD